MTKNDMTQQDAMNNVKKNKRKAKLFAFAVLVIVAVIGISFCYFELFKFEQLVIKGECPYDNSAVLEGIGMNKGDRLYDKSEKQIRESAKYNLPYIDSVEVSHIWPSTLVLTVEQAQPTFYVKISDDMYVLSQSRRVLSRTDNAETVEKNNLILLQIPDITSCVEGEFLETSEETNLLLDTIITGLEECSELVNVTRINVNDKFNIEFMYGTKYLVKLGDAKNLDVKIQFMNAIIEKKKNDGTSGIIDVSDEEGREGTFKNF